MTHPEIIFGTGILGMTLAKPGEFEQAIASLKTNGMMRIDTAARYPPPKQGESERMIGAAQAAQLGFKIDTKILASVGDGSGELEASAIDVSIRDSLGRLGVEKVNTLYCHRFDPKTPLKETAAAMDRHYKAGVFEKWGVCRFTPEKLQELLSVCEEHGYVKPSVYQGEYNVMTRGMETEILPILRAHGMHYNAHRPFATGFLTGKFTSGNYQGTRFAEDFALHQVFRQEYGHEELHEAMQQLETILEPEGISAHEAGLRWILFHSALGAGDGVIFGASRVAQIEDNAKSVRAGPLPLNVAQFMDNIWTKYAQPVRGDVI